MRDRLAEGIGQVTRVAGATNLDAAEAAAAGNAIQRFLVEETRLGIPAILHEETLHGLLARGRDRGSSSRSARRRRGTRSWSRRWRRRSAGGCWRPARRQALAPVLDITRDPRWGRIEETYGEDPYLAAALGCAYVRGIQGDDVADGVVATGKHMVGHGLAEGGLNQAPAHVGPRELRDEQLFPFEAAVRDAGLASVMPAYCDVDGVPCHASHELLTAILRDEWGFDGIVASDYTAIQMLSAQHRLTADLGTAAAMALRAGVDSELPTTAGLRRAAASRRWPTGGSTRRSSTSPSSAMLRLKFRLGLFERPYVGRAGGRRAGPARRREERAARGRARPAVDRARSRTTASCRCGRRRGGSRSSGRSPTAPATCSATTRHLLHIETLAEMRHRANPFGFPLERRDPARSTSWRPAGRSSTGSGRASAPTGSRTPRARACATAPTPRSRRPSRPRAAPRSPSSSSASGPG